MFEQLTGNETTKARLKGLIAAGRVPHAMLFAGPEGIGKRLFALELARAFVCLDPAEGESCGKCTACLRTGEIPIPHAEKGEEYDRVFFGGHADVGSVVPYKRNLRVGSIRALEREANFRPFEGRARFFIVDDADKMNDSAANALLKTLEEPPPTSYIVLITSRPDRLLQTIRSRSQMIRFTPVGLREIERLLTERHEFSPADAALAARVSGGSIGRAVAFDAEGFRAARERMLSIIEHAVRRDGRAEMLRLGEQLNDAKNKDGFEDNLAILENLVRDVWLTASGGPAESILNNDIGGRLASLASAIDPARPAEWLAEIETLRQNFAVNINRKIATDALFMKMAA